MIEETGTVNYPNHLYAEIKDGELTGKWGIKSFNGSSRINIDPIDFDDFNATQGGIFDIINDTAIKVRDRAEYLAKKQKQYEDRLEAERLKAVLNAMDYKTSKYADGEFTEEEWADIVAERKEIRIKIRQLIGEEV